MPSFNPFRRRSLGRRTGAHAAPAAAAPLVRVPGGGAGTDSYGYGVAGGMTGAFRPAAHTKPDAQGLLSRLQAAWKVLRGASGGRTTEQGSSESASPSTAEFTLQSLRYERRRVIADCRRIYEDDTRANRAVKKFAREAVRGGLTITVNTSGRGTVGARARLAREAAEEVQALFNEGAKGGDKQKKLLSWAEMLVVEGDLFLQAVVPVGPDGSLEQTLANIKRMPAASMERCTDDADEPVDPERMFVQVDVSTEAEVAAFPRAVMWHGRWNHIDGERYGRSELMPARRSHALLTVSEEAQVRRRVARATMRYHHSIGNEKHPGDWTLVEEYKAKNGFNDGARDAMDPSEVTRDTFGNGLTSVTAIEGDPNVHNIDDLKYQQDTFATGLPAPKGLIFDSESINRDVLEDQRAEWLKETETLAEALEGAARFFMDLALLLRGVLPESVSYTVQFSESTIETPDQVMARILKARQNTLGGAAKGRPDPLISRRRAVQKTGQFFDVEDVDEELEAIDREIAEMEQAQEEREQRRIEAEAQAGVAAAAQAAPSLGGPQGAGGMTVRRIAGPQSAGASGNGAGAGRALAAAAGARNGAERGSR